MQNLHWGYIQSPQNDSCSAVKQSTLAPSVFTHHISIDFQELKSHSMCVSGWQNNYNGVLQWTGFTILCCRWRDTFIEKVTDQPGF